LKGDSKKFNIRVKFKDIQETRQDRRSQIKQNI